MKNKLLVLPVLILVVSCTSCSQPPAADTEAVTPQTTPDSEIGLAAGTAFDQPPQAPIVFNQVDPGESEVRPRPNEEFPPVIPHSITDMETITLEENSCLDCHEMEVAVDMGAVPVPATHLVDLRKSPDDTGEEVVGSRWVCTSCHVDQTESTELVANTTP